MIKNLIAALLLYIFMGTCCTANSTEHINILTGISLVQHKIPLFKGRDNPSTALLYFTVPEEETVQELKAVKVVFSPGSNCSIVESISLNHKSGDEKTDSFLSQSQSVSDITTVKTTLKLNPGSHTLSLGFRIKAGALLHQSIQIESIELAVGSGKKYLVEPGQEYTYRVADVVRAAGQDSCHTYRIPGLVTTNNGTLIAVYDNRYNNSKDLQENIDVGMSRSNDGGQSWEPMRVIMDMGKWGGRPEQLNGIGDPCVLYDHTTHTIWVAGLWMSGGTPDDMLWWSSRPGISPEETGQLMLTKSTDDGLTWSEPINITRQIKNPGWQLLLQGPGRGITLDDGTLVFPAQFKADTGEKAIDGGQFTSHSTLVYSKDCGATWHIGTGAKPNTTEAQVVKLPDGTLMLNMRDDRNRKVKDETNGRAVAVTADMGKTWTIHPSSNSALPEPNCMASLIAANVVHNGKKQQALFFSNPNNRESRTNMSIKVSLDNGHTWPEKYWLELNERQGFGYSCMTVTDDDCVAILYEGNRELYFQKIPIKDLLAE